MPSVCTNVTSFLPTQCARKTHTMCTQNKICVHSVAFACTLRALCVHKFVCTLRHNRVILYARDTTYNYDHNSLLLYNAMHATYTQCTHNVHTKCTMCIMCTQCARNVHTKCTMCIMCTQCASNVHTIKMHTIYTQSAQLHAMSTQCAHKVHNVHNVHAVCTQCARKMHTTCTQCARNKNVHNVIVSSPLALGGMDFLGFWLPGGGSRKF